MSNPNPKPNPNPNSEEEEEEEDNNDNLVEILKSAISSAHTFLLSHDTTLTPKLSLLLESQLSSATLSLRRLSLPLPLPLPNPHKPLFNHLIAEPNNTNLWRQTIRLSHSTFTKLLTELSTDTVTAVDVAAALFRLGHGAPYAALRRRFSLPSSAAGCHSFFSLIKSISDSLPRNSISYPYDFTTGFVPNCRGALALYRLKLRGNRGGGILVQALVDSAGRFFDVSAGWPGSLSPDAVLHQTRLYLGVEDSPEIDTAESSALNQFVLGDSCFPLLPWLLTPYPSVGGATGDHRAAFNAVHAQAMAVARAAFRAVRRRWRILDRPWKDDCAEFLPFVVVACCLLHNFALNCGEPDVEEAQEDEEEEEEEEEGFGVFEGEVSEIAESVRDALAAQLTPTMSFP